MDHPPDLTPDIKETDLPQEEQEAQPGDLVELPFFDEDFNLKRQVKIPEIDSDLLSSNLRDEFVHPGVDFIRIQLGINFKKAFGKTKKPFPFFDLPTELILEVLPYVHPIDLYHLPLTCRRFYQLLRFKEAEPLWDFVWENEPSVPQRPSFLGYPRWAALLFGPPVCESCHIKFAHTDFDLLKRHCTDCMNERLVHSLREQGDIIHPLLPATMRNRGYDLDGRVWFRVVKDDSDSLRALIEKYDQDIADGVPGTESLRTACIAEKRIEQQDRSRLAYQCNRWRFSIYSEYRERNTQLGVHLLYRFKLLMKSHGSISMEVLTEGTFDEQVNRYIRKAGLLRCNKAAFRELCMGMLGIAYKYQEELEEVARKISRDKWTHNLILDAYRAYLKLKRVSLPSHQTMPSLVPSKEVSEDDTQKKIEVPEGDSLLDKFMPLYNQVKDELFANLMDPKSTLPAHEQFSLATSVFSCCKTKVPGSYDEVGFAVGGCIIGEDAIVQHLSCIDANIHHNEKGQAMAISILKTLGLDPATTTINQLDELGHWYVCLDCEPDLGEALDKYSMPQLGHRCFKWRALIEHVIATSYHGGFTRMAAGWRILKREFHNSLPLERLKENMHYDDPTWYCNHCKDYGDCPRGQVIDHIKKKHGIVEVSDEDDITHHPVQIYTRSKPLPIPKSPQNHFCLLCCTDDLAGRFLGADAFQEHLLGTHGIDEPVTDAFLALDYHFMDLDYALPVVQIEAKLTSPN